MGGKTPGGKGRKRKPPGKDWWEREAREFRKRDSQAYRVSRARARATKLLSTLEKIWREARQERAKSWKQVEDALLSGKANTNTLLALLETAQMSRTYELKIAQNYLYSRAAMEKRLAKETNARALNNAIRAQDMIYEMNAERHFYGETKGAVNADLLHPFAELVSKLNVGKDESYFRLRSRAALAAKGVKRQVQNYEQWAAELREKLASGEISLKKWLNDTTLQRIALAQQHYNLAEAKEELYRHLRRKADHGRLNHFLGVLEREMRRLKERYEEKKGTHAKRFRRKGGRG